MLPSGIHGRASRFMAGFAFVLLATVATAQAQSSAVVVIDSGTEDLFIESMVRTNAESALKNHNHTIVPGAAVGGDTPQRLLACAGDLPCSVAVLEGIAAEHVIFISLRSDTESESSNFKIVVRDYEVTTGEVLARLSRRCTECTEELDLAKFTEQMVIDLVLLSAKQQEAPTEELIPDKPKPVAITTVVPVKPEVIQEAPKDKARLNKVLSYSSLGAGVLAIGVGTYLVLIDGPVVVDGVRQPEANDTLTGGFLSIGAGVALVGVSAFLLTQAQNEGDTQAHLVPTKGGGAVVFTGGF